jgi:hypothetical protein
LIFSGAIRRRSHALQYSDKDFDPFVDYLGLRSAMTLFL